MNKEAMKLAIEHIRQSKIQGSALDRNEMLDEAIKALEEALAKQEQGEPDYKTLAIQLQQERKQGEPVAWMHWLHGPVRLFLNKDEAMMELDRLNREYPVDEDARQMRPLYTAPQPKQEQKYRRGDRLVCLETDEFCVIHISGVDRQWVKFPDSHIGVYTNEQIADMFELLAKEQEQKRPQNCGTSYCSCIECVMDEQEQGDPVGMMVSMDVSKGDEPEHRIFGRIYEVQEDNDCVTYLAIEESRNFEAKQEQGEPVATNWSAVHEKLELVWYRELSADEGLDEIQDLIDTTPQQRTWVGLTEEEVIDLWPDLILHQHVYKFWQNLEAKLKEKNT